jgi:hypothetical protein
MLNLQQFKQKVLRPDLYPNGAPRAPQQDMPVEPFPPEVPKKPPFDFPHGKAPMGFGERNR